MTLKNKLYTTLTVLATIVSLSVSGQSNTKFKVVLDAGHGGKDFGANYHGFIEKNIALSVVLKVGKLLEKDRNIDVIYTRKTDVFIELTERPNIANKADANFFVSIHCNGEVKKVAYGTETFVMGLTKNASNLEVAKKENSVITLESDYKMKYGGFDPNSPQSMIGLMLLQEEYIDQSITLASNVQANFTDDLERKNRGVKQAPFWVLHKTAMPSILIELGFISYKPEGEYLNSEDGQDKVAKSIADAIIKYKKEYYGNGGVPEVAEKDKPSVKTNTPRETAPISRGETIVEKPVTKKLDKKAEERETPKKAESNGVVFKVQIAASGKKLEPVASNFKGLGKISVEQENKIYKYMYGETGNYDAAKDQLKEAKAKGYDSAFIVAFKNGKKVTIQEALR